MCLSWKTTSFCSPCDPLITNLGYRVSAVPMRTPRWRSWQRRTDRLLFTDVVLPGEINGPKLAKSRRPSARTEGAVHLGLYGDHFHHGRLDPGVQLLSKPTEETSLPEIAAGHRGEDSRPAGFDRPCRRLAGRIRIRSAGGDPGWIRTIDLPLRRRPLYPLSYEATLRTCAKPSCGATARSQRQAGGKEEGGVQVLAHHSPSGPSRPG